MARVDEPGPNGSVDQTNSAAAAADAGATNASGPASAAADAGAAQANPQNVNVSARVNSPGDDAGTSQTNSAAADANAAAAGATGSQADASADASQQAPVNLNVSVRVNSPGDQGAVTQANTADASAGATPKTPAVGPQAAGDDANRAAVDNSASVGQTLDQCPGDCSATIAAPATSTISAPSTAPTLTSASATQISPTNVNVSVRVASPGADGAVAQSNTASADADQPVTAATDPANVNVQVQIAGDNGNPSATSNGQPWVWNWNWELGAAPTAAPTETNSWNWDWSDGSSAPQTQVTPVQGHWQWSLTYTTPDGTQVTATFDQPCACAWVWTWTWSGSPLTNAPNAPPTATVPPAQISQTNAATASASATATSNTTQTSTQDAPTQQSDQQIDLIQSATADSIVIQSSSTNSSVITAGQLVSLAQWNTADATSTAIASAVFTQAISQSLELTDGDNAAHRQAASQLITVLQSADANARAAQTGAHNRSKVASRGRSTAQIGAVQQLNTARTHAFASSTSSAAQTIDQHQLGEGADQLELATQDIAITQVAEADAQVAQANLGNTSDVVIPTRGLLNPALTQSNIVHASAQMSNDARVEQEISQSETGAEIAWNETAAQTVTVTQSGDAGAVADQAGIENVSGWTGPLAGEESPVSEGQDGARSPQALTATGIRFGVAPPVRPEVTPRVPEVAKPLAVRFLSESSASISRLGRQSQSAVAGPRAIAAASATRRAQPRVVAGTCAPFCHNGFSGGIDPGSAGGSIGAWYALQPRSFKLAAPGVGRLLDDAPALGRPVDIAPFERPG